MKKIFFSFILFLNFNVNCAEQKTHANSRGPVRYPTYASAPIRNRGLSVNSEPVPDSDENINNTERRNIVVPGPWWGWPIGLCCCLCAMKCCIEKILG